MSQTDLDRWYKNQREKTIVRTLRQMAYERPDLFPALPC